MALEAWVVVFPGFVTVGMFGERRRVLALCILLGMLGA